MPVEIQGKHLTSDSQVQCEKVASGWGLRCRVRVNTGGHQDELAQMLGYDKDTGEFHLFSVSSSGDSHDHRGTFDGTTLNLEYRASLSGKPFVQHVAFSLRGPRELLWKDTCTLGGEVVFAGEGLYRK
jgi:hypothetical protein